MKLTPKQIEAILLASKENDFCAIAHKRTMNSLVRKGLANFDRGFGYRFGAIIELTNKGKEVRSQLISKQNSKQRSKKINMEKFTFYKENKISGKYELPLDEIKTKFVEWMKTKEKDWLEYYISNLENEFVCSPDGLNSVLEKGKSYSLSDELRKTKIEFFKSQKAVT